MVKIQSIFSLLFSLLLLIILISCGKNKDEIASSTPWFSGEYITPKIDHKYLNTCLEKNQGQTVLVNRSTHAKCSEDNYLNSIFTKYTLSVEKNFFKIDLGTIHFVEQPKSYTDASLTPKWA